VKTGASAARNFVQVLAGPVRKALVDGGVERDDTFRDASGGSDHDDHHRARIEQQDLDVADRGRLEGRCRDERKQIAHTGEHLARRLERRIDFTAQLQEIERECARAGVLLCE
jgi:hypothetical protein